MKRGTDTAVADATALLRLGGSDPTERYRRSLDANRRPASSASTRSRARRRAISEIGLWQFPAGAGEFSDDPCLGDSVAVINEFLRHPYAEALREQADLTGGINEQFADGAFEVPRRGRPREAGHWPALYLAFVLSRIPSLQAWVSGVGSSSIWTVCGFSRPLSYPIVHRRFQELEEHWEAFALIAQSLVFTAKQAEPRVGEIVMVDATHFTTPSILEHCCEDAEACEQAGGEPVTTADDGTVRSERAADAEVDEPPDGLPPDPDHNRRGVETLTRWNGSEINYARFFIARHHYRCLDLTAGARKYKGNKAWVGGYKQSATDMLTGCPIAVEIFPADVQEFDGYPALYESMIAALGEPPRVVSGDRLYAFRGFFEFNTRRGVAVVAPRRKRSNRKEYQDWRCDGFDEDGIPRCPNCGGEGDQDSPGLGLVFSRADEPLIRFRCRFPFNKDCLGDKQTRCSEEWAMLLPLSRMTELYHSVRQAHWPKENVNHIGRRRYISAGKDSSSQLCRRGIEPQRLRAWAAVILDWFRLGLRNGWIAPFELPVKVKNYEPQLLSAIQDRKTGKIEAPGIGTERLGRRITARHEADLNLPYGARWDRLAKTKRSDLELETVLVDS